MKQAFLALAVGAAFSLPFAAHAEGGYIGADVGHADVKVSSDYYGSTTKGHTAYKLYGGYDFNQYFGLEAGYVDFGKIDMGYIDESLQAKSQAIYFAAVGTLPLNDQFSLYAKAGISANRVKVDWSFYDGSGSGSYTKNNTSALLGLGAAYHFSKNLSVVAEYDDFGKIEKEDGAHAKANIASLGIRYNF